MDYGIAILAPLVAVLLSALVFVALLSVIYRLLRWLWARLPANALEVTGDKLDKTIGIIFALAVFPSIMFYGWQVVQNLVSFLSSMIAAVGDFSLPGSCAVVGFDYAQSSARLNYIERCSADLSRATTRMLAEQASTLVKSLELFRFPVSSFLWFLLLAIASTQVMGLVRRETAAGQIGTRLRLVIALIPTEFRRRILFFVLVLGSFYLGLSALLAIPLFQDKSKAEQLTPEALIKALDSNIMKPDVFNERFPSPSVVLAKRDALVAEVANSTDSGSPLRSTFEEIIKDAEEQTEGRLQELKKQWDSLRSLATNEPIDLRDQVRNLFSAGIEVGKGQKQTSQHYTYLIYWHQQVTRDDYSLLAKCTAAINDYFAKAGASLTQLRSRLQIGISDPDSFFKTLDRGRIVEEWEDYRISLRDCQRPRDYVQADIPPRPSFSDTLGPVGGWTRWLLDTGQMPVVIIVGLVGFSLLGATISRAVRSAPDKPSAAMTFDDLLIVVTGGATAAMVVFLAAYGGLALLGGSGGDPNPYVVFATCLIGAVYSEDVWAWARTNLLKRNTSGTSATNEAERQRRSLPRSPAGGHRPRRRSRRAPGGGR
jgi:hypothetical protein